MRLHLGGAGAPHLSPHPARGDRADGGEEAGAGRVHDHGRPLVREFVGDDPIAGAARRSLPACGHRLRGERELVRLRGAAGDGELPGDGRQPLALVGDEERHGIDALLAAAAQDAHQPLLRPRPGPGSVAAPVLAVHDGRAQRLLGAPARRLHAGGGEEGEEVRALVAQVRGSLRLGG